MTFAPVEELEKLVGRFTEVDYGNTFEFKSNDSGIYPEFEYIIFVGGYDNQKRFANIKKTVAYVLVDEDKIDKWNIKQHTIYVR